MERARSIPVFMQIVEQIKQRIKSDEFVSGMLLPKETDFAKEFGVARATLRNYLDVLENEGFCELIGRQVQSYTDFELMLTEIILGVLSLPVQVLPICCNQYLKIWPDVLELS